ncbi:MAG: glycosyltransferase family 2 protein [Planctomycetes bacterium]|nr:glycosyltransferase family 2 protein [Planctomycetota bacterium]
MISVVIPFFNEEEVFSKLYIRLTDAARYWDEDYEIIAVDDGSSDSTWTQLERIADLDPRWKIIRLGRNFGHQIALSAGIHHASGDAIVTIDADLQDPPEIILGFIEKWREGYDVVYGIRRDRKEGPLKKLLYFAYYRILSFLANTEIPKDCGDFSMIDRRVADQLKGMCEKHRYIRGMRAWIGLRQTGVEYERAARSAGKAKYNFRKLFHLAFTGIFSFSIVPLRLVSYIGAFLSTISLVSAGYYLFRRLTIEEPVPGFATVIVVVLFLGGIQLIGLGLIGEYVGRIYEEVKRRPLWVIQETKGFETETEFPEETIIPAAASEEETSKRA